ncbi:MAG: sulfatase-like hydrolase/transferase, partial [Lentisphaerae bacterium]|nr:sulfatase-like hydrolase/transferase [Lentisphaerota bacterium]
MPQLKRPNIVVFVSHDTGRHISPYGIPTVKTPHAERLAAEGVMFENAFCASPGCCPSRAALFSGRAPHSVGMYGQAGALSNAFRFASDATHAARYFKDLGYETLLLGLAHEIAGALSPGHYFDGIGFDILKPSQGVKAGTLDTELPAILDLRLEPDKPFYLQIGTKETHTPYLFDGVEPFDELGVTIPESAVLGDGAGTREEFSLIQGAVNRLDEGLGHMLNFLDERGLSDNTLLVFTADHGLPLPREKTTLYDRGIGVLLMMRYPGVFAPDQRCKGLVSHIDVLP